MLSNDQNVIFLYNLGKFLYIYAKVMYPLFIQ